MNNPISTYRVQFHKGFNFEAFQQIIPYLHDLGVKTIYASPIFTSTPGSTHGYDGLNPHEINPEIGTEEQLRQISAQLKVANIKWVQDIVPNHMAFHPANPWLTDVLEKGKQSEYASFFDINWESETYNGKILVPFLGTSLNEAINNELRLEFDGIRFVFKYYDSAYPLSPKSYSAVLNSIGSNLQDVRQLIQQLDDLQQVEHSKTFSNQWSEVLLQLDSLMRDAAVKAHIDNCLEVVNSNRGVLSQILDEQVYKLEHWKETDKQINFRRFFTVNGLICLNIQDGQVFSYFHSYVKELLDDGIFQGLRIDHIDGLSDPELYLKELRSLVGEDVYIIVEKILGPSEVLPNSWPIEGNTGYDFLSMVNNLFANDDAEKAFTKYYKKLIGDKRPVGELIAEKKGYILRQHMAGELDNLYQLFLDLNLIDRTEIETDGDLREAIAEFLIYCPVYRYYGNRLPLEAEEANAIQDILNRIRNKKALLHSAVNLLEQALLIKPAKEDPGYRERAMKFYMRCMQFTGPLMAKGVEDTLMYTYNRFIGHNEVGDSPETFGYDIETFHKLMAERQLNWPLSLNGTSTHDTKRGEDVRARLNVLTDLADRWIGTIQLWQELNAESSQQYHLSENDEYFIYQTLVGTMPMPGENDSDYETRIHEYLVKALREGKISSDWAKPDEDYERRAMDFASALLDKDGAFYKLLRKFNRNIADFGIANSLAQLVLKFTCPGVPDIYQGTELWDLSLVDPDNRRPVNYSHRAALLEKLDSTQTDTKLMAKLWEDRYSGAIKLWLTKTLLKLRADNQEFFMQADYFPLEVKGKYKDHVLAFARRFQHQWMIVAVPLHLARISKMGKKDFQNLKWKNTRIVLPSNIPSEMEDLVMKSISKAGKEIFIKEAFAKTPFAVFKLQKRESGRGAGVLLHITSLPSPFGIGDFGPGAKTFADYLSSAGQKYWQILPLSPTEAGQGYSPYSAISTMGGNTLLISPELLAEEGLLDASMLQQYRIKSERVVDYASAKQIKDRLFDEAYHNFCNSESSLRDDFRNFCERESHWLDDFAFYLSLKNQNQGKPWFEWPPEYKLRDKKALEQFSEINSDVLNKIKWLQFIFLKQWTNLKNYCNKSGIKLFGDLPFYVSNDSSDVWANKDIFCLDEDGRMTGMAGVPPDYFNDNGQLWGMPVFKWDVLKGQNYDWWIQRIRKNMQLYDLLRLDHFRAFSSYWDVPSGEETAKNGEWKPGPASDFFRVLEQELGELPFVAEDLGDVDQPVYDLRDEFGLPGMRVLQFSFGDDGAQSVHSLHNFNPNSVVYTGTHDNNTTKGWFRKDADIATRENLNEYLGKEPTEKNIHLLLGKRAYSSVARIVILPMQDVIGLDEKARMNTPASVENNWTWRLKAKQLRQKHSKRLLSWARMFNRG
ncbi:malto-oligosyltrehalose synthase [Paradesertivirga mongoliensis]|uniref:4-alpha-glucanotransferase n=1 Tax=Paradesertivirga mongoliensis TaxID=2100740 RepID=A0ABW4ZJ14_9SPHI|nr:malto-oligosyltrehalose synthase [Pedobacter mongoliensis]